MTSYLIVLLAVLATSVSSFTAVIRPACRHCAPAVTPAFARGVPIVLQEGEEPAAPDDAAPEAAAEEEDEEEDLLSTPAFLKQKLKVLEKELADVEEQTRAAKDGAGEEAGEWADQRTRLQGDFDNFKARHLNQTLEAQLDSRIKVLTEFLPVLDNFDRARESISPEGAGQEATNAEYSQMHADLMAALGGELKMEKIEAVGQEFDYNMHMAIQQMPSDEYDEGIVCTEMQPGYTCQGKLVRAAYVAVAL